MGDGVFRFDLTEAEGLDDLHHPEGAILEAQRLAAELYGADRSWFLVNGTTCGNEAKMCIRDRGYDENMYLDAATRTKVEETGGANFLFVTKDNRVVTPKSDTILPSITRRSLMYVAKEYLGLETEEREVHVDELNEFAECGLCGTAAVISPVGKIVDHGKEICLPSGMKDMGPVTRKLYDTLTGIQMGRLEAPKDVYKRQGMT